MFPAIDPKKMQALMKQMGISQKEIEAKRVIIEKEDGRIIIENPEVVKVNMSGKESFQISGEIKEESFEDEENNIEQDIASIVEQTGADREIVAIELEKNNGDIAETIINLKKR
jgi:alpha-NAC-related protein